MKRTAHHHVNVERIFLVIESDCRYRPGFFVALKAIASDQTELLEMTADENQLNHHWGKKENGI